MSKVEEEDAGGFFEEVNAAAKKAIWAAVATLAGKEPRVRMVHPTWEGRTLWFATSATSAKARQLRQNPAIDIQFQVAPPDFVHLMVRGRVELPTDDDTRHHVWEVLDYELADFWPDGVDNPDYQPVKVIPSRVELSAMFGTQNKRVWVPE
jgi:general stress protein 26